MIIKDRKESEELKILRQLHLRKSLLEKDRMNYLYLEKGYLGELAFDKLFDHLNYNLLILNDLLLEINGTYFQLDKVVISPGKIYIFEVKNYEGDYYLEKGNWYNISGTETKNLITQMTRSESSFRRLLAQVGFTSTIESYLIFINPEFHLYNAPINLPIVYPTQLIRFLNQFQLNIPKIKDRNLNLAEKLSSLHISKSPFTRIPFYEYVQLKKGIHCPICGSFNTSITELELLQCTKCNHNETFEYAVLRNVDEFRLLFPSEKLTTNNVVNWCEIINFKRSVQQILARNFKQMGWGKNTFYN